MSVTRSPWRLSHTRKSPGKKALEKGEGKIFCLKCDEMRGSFEVTETAAVSVDKVSQGGHAITASKRSLLVLAPFQPLSND